MTLKEILEITRKRMNKEKYNKKIIFPNGKAGMIQKAIEIELGFFNFFFLPYLVIGFLLTQYIWVFYPPI